MSIFVALGADGLLMACLCFGPGFFFVRRLRWSRIETLCASVGLSCILLYLVGFLLKSLESGPAGWYAATVALLALSAASGRSLWTFLRGRAVRRVLAGFAFLVAVGVLLLALVRHTSGGRWAGDYWEHFERCRFFLGQLPLDYRFIGLYWLPARPPLMNVVGALFMAQVGDSFLIYQFTFLFLSLLVYFPLALLARMIAPRAGRFPGQVAVFLALSPVLWQNATFTWTKLFCGFYVLLGLALYLRGWQKSDPLRIAGAFISLTAGVLVHYSAAVFALFISLHYGYLLLRGAPVLAGGRDRRCDVRPVARELGGLVDCGVRHKNDVRFQYHGHRLERALPSAFLEKIGQNLFFSIVPHPVHLDPDRYLDQHWQPNELGTVRDYWFMTVQTTVLMMMGCVAWVAVLWLLIRGCLWRWSQAPPTRWFWILFIPWCLVVGVAVHGTIDPYGVGHICLQPLVLLGITYLAVRFASLPGSLRFLLVVGASVDWALGVLIHFHVQNYSAPAIPAAGDWLLDPSLPSDIAILNILQKNYHHVTYFGDLFERSAPLLEFAVFAVGVGLVYRLVRPQLRTSGRTRVAPVLAGLAGLSVLVCVYAWCFARPTPGPPVIRSEDRARVLGAVQEQPDSASNQLDAALVLYADRGWAAGLNNNCDAYLFDPTDRRARYFLVLTRTLSVCDQKTVYDLEAAERVHVTPDDSKGWSVVSAILLVHGHSEAAARVLAEAIRASGDPAESYEATGDFLLVLSRPDLAIKMYDMGVRSLDPSDTSPRDGSAPDVRQRLRDKILRVRP